MAERVGIYIHPTARVKEQWRGIDLSQQLGKKGHWEWLKHPLKIPDEVDTAVIVGGDGSLRAAAHVMSRRERPGVILSMPGGSQNGFWGSLERNEDIVSAVDVADVTPCDIKPFSPLDINGQFALYSAEVGDSALTFSRYDEQFRGISFPGIFIPRGRKMHVAAIAAALKHAKIDRENPDEPLLQAFVTASDYRGHEVFPGQDLHSNDITHVTVPQMTKKGSAEFCWEVLKGVRRGGHFPEGLLHLEKGSRIVIPHSGDKICLGGDPSPSLRKHDTLIAVRDTEHPIYIAALTFPKQRRRRVL